MTVHVNFRMTGRATGTRFYTLAAMLGKTRYKDNLRGAEDYEN